MRLRLHIDLDLSLAGISVAGLAWSLLDRTTRGGPVKQAEIAAAVADAEAGCAPGSGVVQELPDCIALAQLPSATSRGTHMPQQMASILGSTPPPPAAPSIDTQRSLLELGFGGDEAAELMQRFGTEKLSKLLLWIAAKCKTQAIGSPRALLISCLNREGTTLHAER